MIYLGEKFNRDKKLIQIYFPLNKNNSFLEPLFPTAPLFCSSTKQNLFKESIIDVLILI
jgi:hypothetical protein